MTGNAIKEKMEPWLVSEAFEEMGEEDWAMIEFIDDDLGDCFEDEEDDEEEDDE